MKPIKLALVTMVAVSITGCFEGRKNTEQLCNDNPALRCEQLNINDGQCRVPRTDLIWHRFEVLKNPTDTRQIKEYQLVSEYKKCLELASQIQPIDQTELKQRRFNALIHSGEEQERIAQELKKSNSPQALYFLWSQIGDDQAKRAFLQLEGSPALETAEMQYALATFYTSRDLEKTIKLLNHALELSKGNNVNPEIFKSLASINYRLNNKERAYVWAIVASNFDVPIASDKELQLLYGFSDAKYRQLQELADDLESAIKSGKYRTSMTSKID